MKIDLFSKLIAVLFIIWLFFNSILRSSAVGALRADESSLSTPDAYYLYFNNSAPFRINIATGETWFLNSKIGAWELIPESDPQ